MHFNPHGQPYPYSTYLTPTNNLAFSPVPALNSGLSGLHPVGVPRPLLPQYASGSHAPAYPVSYLRPSVPAYTPAYTPTCLQYSPPYQTTFPTMGVPQPAYPQLLSFSSTPSMPAFLPQAAPVATAAPVSINPTGAAPTLASVRMGIGPGKRIVRVERGSILGCFGDNTDTTIVGQSLGSAQYIADLNQRGTIRILGSEPVGLGSFCLEASNSFATAYTVTTLNPDGSPSTVTHCIDASRGERLGLEIKAADKSGKEVLMITNVTNPQLKEIISRGQPVSDINNVRVLGLDSTCYLPFRDYLHHYLSGNPDSEYARLLLDVLNKDRREYV